MEVWGLGVQRADSGLVAERLHWLDLPALLVKRLPWVTARAQTTDGGRNWVALDDHTTLAERAVAFVGEGFAIVLTANGCRRALERMSRLRAGCNSGMSTATP